MSRLVLRDSEALRACPLLKQRGEAVLVRVLMKGQPENAECHVPFPGEFRITQRQTIAAIGGTPCKTIPVMLKSGKLPTQGEVWIAETWARPSDCGLGHDCASPVYKASWPPSIDDRHDAGLLRTPKRWRSPMTMPRDLSRFGRVTSEVRVCRASQVTEAEALGFGGWSYGACPIHKSPERSMLMALGISDPRTWVAVARLNVRKERREEGFTTESQRHGEYGMSGDPTIGGNLFQPDLPMFGAAAPMSTLVSIEEAAGDPDRFPPLPSGLPGKNFVRTNISNQIRIYTDTSCQGCDAAMSPDPTRMGRWRCFSCGKTQTEELDDESTWLPRYEASL